MHQLCKLQGTSDWLSQPVLAYRTILPKTVISSDIFSLAVEIMIEAALVQQLSSLLAPALPYLMGSAVVAGKKAAEIVGGKISEEAWNKAQKVWDKLSPWVYKKPEVTKALKEVANNADDPIYTNALALPLKKLLEEMPPETVNEIKNIIVSQTKSESRVTKADHGGVAIGGNMSGGIINAGYHSSNKKPE